jgi:RimJ/RimL family protein N-acetyltransferase
MTLASTHSKIRLRPFRESDAPALAHLFNNRIDTRYTFYPYASHNSWDSTFNEPELLNWLMSHEK